MKNSLNLVLSILFLAVLGCSCPKLSDLTKGKDAPAPSAPSSAPDTAATPSSAGRSPQLTIDKYNQLKNKMTRSEVERILGGPGTEFSSSTGGGVTYSVYKWEGDDYKMIIITFENDKVFSKSQTGLK
jgi:outer membrane protein assembly factor BamE (lipoprotein component of BamABCDE complex)